jgi:YD repeat-containing protein
MLWRNSDDTATIVGFKHDYDKVGNPSYETRVHQDNYGDAYMYDNLYRLTRVIYDDGNPASPTYAVERAEDFLMDPIGNRTKLYAKSATATEYLHNPVNEYTKVGGTAHEYDAAGNLTKDATQYYFWDYENRLTKVKAVDGGADVAEYAYDARMRRVEKTDYTPDPDATTSVVFHKYCTL